MKILIAHNGKIPALLYGGTERVIWYLGRTLRLLGHEVSFLVPPGSTCDFAAVCFFDPERNLNQQIPEDVDLIHFHFIPKDLEFIQKPYLITLHGNASPHQTLPHNTVFVSRNHALRHGSDCFVYNGLDWQDYSKPQFEKARKYYHFLGKAAWRVKNVKGAIRLIQQIPNEHLHVLGGVRFNFNMGIRFTFSPRIHFHGMIGGREKDTILNGSKGLIFPVRWPEPFGLAIIESLFFGCPVFGTPYGSLPELVPSSVGCLSANSETLLNAMHHVDSFNRNTCHEYANDCFNSRMMAEHYVSKYEQVLAGRPLNAVHPKPIIEQPGQDFPFI